VEVVVMGVEPVLTTGAARDPVSVQGGQPLAELADPAGIADWRGDVALELWVETEAVPPRIRLAGRLDATTAANLAQVVHELMAEGTVSVELCTEGLRVIDSSALGALADIERQVRVAGGSLVRVGPDTGPFVRARLGVAPPVARG
jgi:anti-anti-sigma factor